MVSIEELKEMQKNRQTISDEINLKLNSIVSNVAQQELIITNLNKKIQRIEHLLLSNNIK